MKKKLLVFGARKKSIGQMVGNMWGDMYDGQVETAGLTHDEKHNVHYEDYDQMIAFLAEQQPDRVLVTIGRNETLADFNGDTELWLNDILVANVIRPMMILDHWIEAGMNPGAHFVVISSNSAHIPRSGSMAYCASKAALSMAIRCAARDFGKAGMDASIYGFEPGLVKGTPMSGKRGGTRMLGLPQGMPRRSLAVQIANTMAFGGPEQNGVLHRIDAGEV